MTIEIWLGIALAVSCFANVSLMWFSRIQSVRLTYVSANIGDLIQMLVSYRAHLKKVYGMEMFYGDQTLSNLMDHTRAIIDIIEQDYGDITAILDPIELDEIEQNEEESEEIEIEKDVLYAGTRERNP